jgi:adenylate cyclase
MGFLNELRRRNVLRVGAAYIVTAWLVIQVVETLFPIYGLSDAAARMVVNILAIGLVPVLVLSWVFEWTPEGLKRDAEVTPGAPSSPATAKRLDRVILTVLALALGYFAFDKFVLDPARDVEIAQVARQEGRSEAIIESYGEASIAVLAFADMSPNKDQEYLSDGIAEEILHLLARISELRVISRSSAFSYKGKDTSVPEIARQLNVAHVLEGSVRKAGDRIRVTAQLIEARTDTHVWSQTYDRTLDDIFAIQDELAATMVHQLQITLLGETPKADRINPEAYLLYLQGHHFADYRDPERATALLEQALAIEPDYVEALLDLARAHWQQSETLVAAAHIPQDLPSQRATAAFEKAKALEPEHPAVLAYSAYDYLELGEYIPAARELEHALALHPRHPEVVRSAAIFARFIGRDDLYMQLSRGLLQDDPLCASCSYHYARSLFQLGRYEEAIETMEAFRALVSRDSGEITLGLSYLELGNVDRALETFDLRGDAPDSWYGPMIVRARRGEDIAPELEKIGSEIPEQSLYYFQLAQVYAVSGDIDNAFKWIEKGEEISIPVTRDVLSRYFENLHDDPRWQGVLERAGLAPHQVAEINFDPPLPGE